MARWIGTYEGVPPASEFGTTRGDGTPLVIDTLTGDLYYLSDANVVTPAGGGGGSAVAAYDEGVLLTAGVTSLDFTGAGVTATAVGTAVTINVTAGGGGLTHPQVLARTLGA